MEKYPYIKRYLEMRATGNEEYIKYLMNVTELQMRKRNHYAKQFGGKIIPITEDNIKKEVEEFLKDDLLSFSKDLQLINE